MYSWVQAAWQWEGRERREGERGREGRGRDWERERERENNFTMYYSAWAQTNSPILVSLQLTGRVYWGPLWWACQQRSPPYLAAAGNSEINTKTTTITIDGYTYNCNIFIMAIATIHEQGTVVGMTEAWIGELVNKILWRKEVFRKTLPLLVDRQQWRWACGEEGRSTSFW